MSESDSSLQSASPKDRRLSGVLGVMVLFVAIYLGAIAVLTSLLTADVDPGTDPTDPRLSLLLVLALLVVSAAMLAIFRWGLGWLLRGFISLVSMGVVWIVVGTLIPPGVVVAGLHVPAVACALLAGVGLLRYPRWWVIDLVGVVIGAGAIALFAISVGPLPVIVLLVILAVYDAISVYGTGHMLSLAEGAISARLPVMLIVPTNLEAAFHDPALDDETMVVIGLGDVVVPGMLVGAAIAHGPGATLWFRGLALTPAALGTIIGILAGLLGLFLVLTRRGPQPGLPFLNTGALVGYLVGAVVGGAGLGQAIGL